MEAHSCSVIFLLPFGLQIFDIQPMKVPKMDTAIETGVY